MSMVPMSMASGVAKQIQQAKREMTIATSMSSGTNESAAGANNNNSLLTLAPRKEELRFLPLASMPTPGKPCSITISNVQAHNMSNNHQNQLPPALKTKLTQMNIVPKPLKGSGAVGTSTSAPLFQLLPAAASKPSQQPLVILTPSGKTATVIGTTGQTNVNSHPVVIRPGQAQIGKAHFAIQGNALSQAVGGVAVSSGAVINPGPTPTPTPLVGKPELVQKSAIATSASGTATTSTLPVQVANPGGTKISLIKPRSPLILSKSAVDKLRWKFNQAKANSGSVIISKSGSVKKVLPMPPGSEDIIRTSQNNNNINGKAAPIPIKAVSVVSDNNNKGTVKTKTIIKAVPLPVKEDTPPTALPSVTFQKVLPQTVKVMPLAPASTPAPAGTTTVTTNAKPLPPAPIPTVSAPTAPAPSPKPQLLGSETTILTITPANVPFSVPKTPNEKAMPIATSNTKAVLTPESKTKLERALNGPLKKGQPVQNLQSQIHKPEVPIKPQPVQAKNPPKLQQTPDLRDPPQPEKLELQGEVKVRQIESINPPKTQPQEPYSPPKQQQPSKNEHQEPRVAPKLQQESKNEHQEPRVAPKLQQPSTVSGEPQVTPKQPSKTQNKEPKSLELTNNQHRELHSPPQHQQSSTNHQVPHSAPKPQKPFNNQHEEPHSPPKAQLPSQNQHEEPHSPPKAQLASQNQHEEPRSPPKSQQPSKNHHQELHSPPKQQQPEKKTPPKPKPPERKEPPKLQPPEIKKLSKGGQLGPKLQRSKSFVGSPEVSLIPCERRHSVAIMAKEVDVIEQPCAPIETITIEDDDSEEETVQPIPQPIKKPIVLPILPAGITISTTRRSSGPATKAPISSRKSSSSSSNSDVVEVPMGMSKLKEELSLLPGISIVKAESLPVTKEDFERSLRCDEQVPSTPPSSSSSASVASDLLTPPKSVEPVAPQRATKNGDIHIKEASSLPGSRANALKKSMHQNLSMLQWRGQQPANLQNSSLRFELNRFNLLQLNERCEPRRGPANYFDRALYDRASRRPSGSAHPLLYLCQRCNCHGPAADFLAPHFCSLNCVRRGQKRRLPPSSQTESKMSRTQPEPAPSASFRKAPSNNKAIAKTLEQPNRMKEKGKKPFRWSEYLKSKGKDVAAPIHLFLNPFPITPNCFERGMKLEAIDPENCSLFCVCTIAEIRGYRLRLSFDGYSSMYDFWVNADSQDIFPPGWCEETNRVLQAPKGYCSERFSWNRYLVKTGVKAAPRSLFTHLNISPQAGVRNGFVVGMHLEAEDLNDTGKICVATIADTLDERIRVHFDGWDDCYDLWVHISSPYIHPCGWHEGRQQLIVPPDYQKSVFSWPDYIADVGGIAAPKHLFTPRQPMEFHGRMKLEVVDQRNPCLIRPATVVTRKGYRVQIHFDCWPSEYFFWLEDDSPDLHPIGWCEATSHDLETPPGFLQSKPVMPCDTEGCRGFGNAKRFNLNVHALQDCCPYLPENWRQWRSKTVKPARIAPESIWRGPERKFKRASTDQDRVDNHKRFKPEVLPPKATKTENKPEVKQKVSRRKPKHVPKQEKEQPKDQPPKKNEPVPQSLALAIPIVKDYGPQYVPNYRLWQRNSAFDLNEVRSNPLNWTKWDVFEYIEQSLESEEIAKTIFDEDIDGRALLMIGRQELEKYLKLKMGPAVKLFSLIVNLRIAVVCKFETTTTGLGIYSASKKMKSKTKTEKLDAPVSAKEKVNGFKLERVDDDADPSDDEDVVLDSEDFLSVEACHMEENDEDMDGDVDADPDCVMVPLETRRPMAAS
ncbi:hypothetical protein KR026_007400 [Drosophila bipectinata]|nr:hypothetical protein KR026_007400 [Drosophila bipectinata]